MTTRSLSLVALLLATLIVLQDVRLAQAAVPSTPIESDVWNQFSPQSPVDGSCQGGSCVGGIGVVANGGQPYIVISAINSRCYGQVTMNVNANGATAITLSWQGLLNITQPALVASTSLLTMTNITGGIYGAISFTLNSSATITLNFGAATSQCNQFFSGSMGFINLPPGVTEVCGTGVGTGCTTTGIMSLVGTITEYSGGGGSCPNAGVNCHPAGYLLYDTTSLLSEVGIENTEATTNAHVGSVIGTGFNPISSMTQLNSEQGLVNTGQSGNNYAGQEIVQSFTPNSALGNYVGHTSFLEFSMTTSTCTSTVTLSTSSVNMITNGGAWNITNETANITATVTKASGAGVNPFTVTVDWNNGTISDTSTLDTYTGVVLSVGGSSAGVVSSAFAPFVGNGVGTSYLRFFETNLCAQPTYSTANLYAGGTAFNRTAGSVGLFTTQAGDMEGLAVNVFGGTTIQYNFATTAANVGGSVYAYVYEITKDADPQKYTLSSSFGGSGRFGNYQYASGASRQQVTCRTAPFPISFVSACSNSGTYSQCPDNSCAVLQEWRLGYLQPEWTTPQTLTFTVNSTGSGRNQLYLAVINTANEPAHPHVAGPLNVPSATAGFSPFQLYEFFSTNDFLAQLTLQVHSCSLVAADGSCTDATTGAYGAVIPNGTYSGSVTVGSSRFIAGQWDANGTFNVTGQDVQGGNVKLVISATGYVTDSAVVVNVPNTPGNYTVNLTMLPAAQGNGLGVKQSAVQVSFNATNPQFSSGQFVLVSINRTLNVDLWVILFKLDSNGNPLQAGAFAPYDWTPSQNNELDVSWPDGRALNDADSGAYVLSVFIAAKTTTKGVLVAYDSIGVNQAAVSVGTSLLTNLNVAGQNDISTQSQVNAAVSSGVVTEATVQQDFLTFLDWFPRSDLLIPNAVLYPCLFMGAALMLRFGRQRWGA